MSVHIIIVRNTNTDTMFHIAIQLAASYTEFLFVYFSLHWQHQSPGVRIPFAMRHNCRCCRTRTFFGQTSLCRITHTCEDKTWYKKCCYIYRQRIEDDCGLARFVVSMRYHDTMQQRRRNCSYGRCCLIAIVLRISHTMHVLAQIL